MIHPMRTFICSIVFLDLVGFSKEKVDHQISLKETLNGLISEIISEFPESEHIIIDCGDGAAVGFVGDPEYALYFAINLRNAIIKKDTGLVARIGINLGPVKLVEDLNGHPNLIGDGINVAQRIMSFAEPNQITVSRSFHEVTSCLSKNIADLYAYIGSKTDKHVRKYQVYAIANSQPDSSITHDTDVPDKREGDTVAQSAGAEETALPNAPKRNKMSMLTFSLKQNWKLYGLSIAAIIAAAFALLQGTGKPKVAEQKISKQNNIVVFAPLTSTGANKQKENSFAVIHFKVIPQGVIYIDGQKKGIASTTKNVTVERGEHTVLIKSDHFKDYRKVVHLDPNESILIEHHFRKKSTTAASKSYIKRKKSTGKISSGAFTSTFTPQ